MPILNAMEGAVSQGVLWGLMALGVYLTFRILNVADMTVDGSFAAGGAVTAVFLTRFGVNPLFVLLISFVMGTICGLITGLMNTKLKINILLASILTQIALYSVNIRIMGRANTPLLGSTTLITLVKSITHGHITKPSHISLIVGVVVIAAIIALMYWFFGTEIGSSIRATGSNEHMVRAMGAKGVFGNRIRVYCAENASVTLVTVNLLGTNLVHFNGIGSSLKDSAHLDLVQIELGGKETYSGSYNNLLGYKASCSVQGGYVCDGDKVLDINYVSNQSGSQTESFSKFNGVLLDNAKKTWRGTIDFKRGAKEAKGDEQENVLLLSPDVVNKSMPVILCDEENVEGRHGGSIGKLSEEELLYLETRGIDERTAKIMMIKSRINSIARFIPDADVLDNIHAYLEEHL